MRDILKKFTLLYASGDLKVQTQMVEYFDIYMPHMDGLELTKLFHNKKKIPLSNKGSKLLEILITNKTDAVSIHDIIAFV